MRTLELADEKDGGEVAIEELGKIYHYYTGQDFYLIYSEDAISLDDVLAIEKLEENGTRYVIKKRYKAYPSEQGYRIELSSGLLSAKQTLVLKNHEVDSCYIVDNTQHGSYPGEVFCRVLENGR